MKATDNCLNYIGCCHIALQSYSAAESCYSELLQKRPKWIQPYINMARVYLNSKVPEKAYPYLLKAAEIDAHNIDVLYYLGIYYYDVKEYSIAIQYLQKSLDIDFNQSDGHLTLGSAYYRAGLYRQALEEFTIGYEMDSSQINALFDQALVYMELEEYDKALPILVEVAKNPSDNTKYLRALGACHYYLHDYGNAKNAFNAVLELDPENEYAQRYLKMISEKI